MLPAGKYFVGDPCYVISSRTTWQTMHNIQFEESEGFRREGEFFIRTEDGEGIMFADYSTSFGDGVYQDHSGHYYYVDSGGLGVVQWKEWMDEEKATRLGQIVTFANPIRTGRTVDGRFVFVSDGKTTIAIDTDPEDDDEEEDV